MSRRKGKLGKHEAITPSCYASAIIGGCNGPLTEEHPFSESLRRKKKFQFTVRTLDSKGSWNTRSLPNIYAKHASAKILCKKHNGDLSLADMEAQKLQDAISSMYQCAKSPLYTTSTRSDINGKLWAQYLCKFIVGSFIIFDPTAPPITDLVRFAFGHPTTKRIYFYTPEGRASHSWHDREHDESVSRYVTDTNQFAAYEVNVFGIRIIITQIAGITHRIDPQMTFSDRLGRMQVELNGVKHAITFYWGDTRMNVT
jgi:phosphoribosylformylglycinamidine (FGAM) synthase-like amidotransferase family enzyme